MAPRKRIKLSELGGLKRCTDSALSAILRGLQDQGVLDAGYATGRTAIESAVTDEVTDESNFDGGVLQILRLPLANGNDFCWTFGNTQALLNYFANRVPEFSDNLWSASANFCKSGW